MEGKKIIRDVWNYNLESEMENVRKILKTYKWVSIDTEFPGVIINKLPGLFKDEYEYNYKIMRSNIEVLNIIQMGLTFMNISDENPNKYIIGKTFQFNFLFDLDFEKASPEAIGLLKDSGIDFDRHKIDGISQDSFGSMIFTSGLISDDSIKWVSFQGYYDFGYFFKILRIPLPFDIEDFFILLKHFFPLIYDIKYIMNFHRKKGGLQDLAKSLSIQRIGKKHQAGSDSLLTAETFIKMWQENYDNQSLITFQGLLQMLNN